MLPFPMHKFKFRSTTCIPHLKRMHVCHLHSCLVYLEIPRQKDIPIATITTAHSNPPTHCLSRRSPGALSPGSRDNPSGLIIPMTGVPSTARSSGWKPSGSHSTCLCLKPNQAATQLPLLGYGHSPVQFRSPAEARNRAIPSHCWTCQSP